MYWAAGLQLPTSYEAGPLAGKMDLAQTWSQAHSTGAALGPTAKETSHRSLRAPGDCPTLRLTPAQNAPFLELWQDLEDGRSLGGL